MSRRLEARLTRWGLGGGLLLAASGTLFAALLATAWGAQTRALSAAAQRYAQEESESLARLLLYDLSGDARVLSCRLFDHRLSGMRRRGLEPKAGEEPPAALLAFVSARLGLPDAVVWDQALKADLRCDLRGVTAARFRLYEAELERGRKALSEELSARVSVSDHLRGIRLATRSGTLTLSAGEAPGGAGRADATFPLVVEGEPWADVTVSVDLGYLEEIRKGLGRSLAQLAAVLTTALLLALALWGLLWWRLLRDLRRTVAEPVTHLAARMEAFERGDAPAEPEGDEAALLTGAFERLVGRVAASREQLHQAQEERQQTFRALARLMAHELRNPLTPMRLWLQEIQALPDDGTETARTVREAAPVLLDQVERLDRLVDRFRNLAEDRPLEPHPVAVAPVATSVANALRAQAERGGVALRVEVEEGLTASADDTALHQLLLNLARNAVEAQAGRGGEILLRGRRAGGRAQVDVEDRGGGLPPEVAAAPFTPYLTTKPGGTGLGLVACRELAARMGGRLELEDRPGEGLTARLSLPLSRESGTAPA